MKKFLAFILMAVMALTVLAGCSNPVFDDFENFLNVEMAEISADYGKIAAEVSAWSELESDEELAKSITDILLPLVTGSLEKLADIIPATEEVTGLKEKYVKVMESYKTGFEALLEGCETKDEAAIDKGNEALNEGIAYLDEYNAALEEMAKSFGMEIQY